MAKSKLFFDVVASLDGLIAPEGMDLAHADDQDFKPLPAALIKKLVKARVLEKKAKMKQENAPPE